MNGLKKILLTGGIVASSLFNINSASGQNNPNNFEKDRNVYHIEFNEKKGCNDTINIHTGHDKEGNSIKSFKTKKDEKKYFENFKEQFNPSNKNSKELPDNPQHPMYGLHPYIPCFEPDFSHTSNQWELKSYDEKITLVNDFIQNSPTAHMTFDICSKFVWQEFITGNGIYDIYNSGFSSSTYDFSYNGEKEFPARYASVKTMDGTSHGICAIFVGDEDMTNNNATDFSQWVFWEPQTNQIVTPGDYSFNPNEYAKITSYNFYWNEPFSMWDYDTRTNVEFDLNNGNGICTFSHPEFINSWTPFDSVEYPSNKSLEYYVGIESETSDTSSSKMGAPNGLYPGTILSYTDDSTRTNNGTCSDVSYDINRNWNLIAGAYETSHIQNISVSDNTPPTNTESIWTDNSGLDVIVTNDTISTQGSDSTQCDFWDYDVNYQTVGTDVCGNSTTVDSVINFEDNSNPEYLTFPNDTVVPHNGSIEPESTGIPTWSDNAPVVANYSDEIVEDTDEHIKYERTWNGTDACGNSSVDSVQYVTQEKPDGLEKIVKTDNVKIYPNPARDYITIENNYSNSENTTGTIYNTAGQKIREIKVGEYETNVDISDLPTGMYLLKTENGKVTEMDKIVKKE